MHVFQVSISESEVEVAQVLYGLTRLQSHSPPAKPEIVQSSSPPPKLDFKHNSANEGSLSVASKASSPVSTPISPPSSSHQMVLPQHSSSTHVTTVMGEQRNVMIKKSLLSILFIFWVMIPFSHWLLLALVVKMLLPHLPCENGMHVKNWN